MTNIQTLEIVELLKSLPSEKIAEVKDFVLFLRERHKDTKTIDESDEWSDEDLQDAVLPAINYSKDENNSNIIPPRCNSLKEDGEVVLGIWADREEDALEIARTI
jgi:hypothetical protein